MNFTYLRNNMYNTNKIHTYLHILLYILFVSTDANDTNVGARVAPSSGARKTPSSVSQPTHSRPRRRRATSTTSSKWTVSTLALWWRLGSLIRRHATQYKKDDQSFGMRFFLLRWHPHVGNISWAVLAIESSAASNTRSTPHPKTKKTFRCWSRTCCCCCCLLRRVKRHWRMKTLKDVLLHNSQLPNTN